MAVNGGADYGMVDCELWGYQHGVFRLVRYNLQTKVSHVSHKLETMHTECRPVEYSCILELHV